LEVVINRLAKMHSTLNLITLHFSINASQ